MFRLFSFLAIVALSVSFPTHSQAQSNLMDVVYLKNGSIIKGIIVEQVPGQAIKLQTADGSVFVFESEEITKMTREAQTNSSPSPSLQPAPATATPAPKDRDEWGRTYKQNMEFADRRKAASIGLLSAGSVLTVGGVVLIAIGADKNLPPVPSFWHLTGGIAATAVGISFLGIGGGLWSAQLKYRRRAQNMSDGTANLSPVLINTQRYSGPLLNTGTAIGVQFAFRF